jgi:hypothetical protein
MLSSFAFEIPDDIKGVSPIIKGVSPIIFIEGVIRGEFKT